MKASNLPPSTFFELELIEKQRTHFLDLWQVPRLRKKVSVTIATGSEELRKVKNG